MDPGRLEAILATADAEDVDERSSLRDGYTGSGYDDLAEAVGQADRTIDKAETIVVHEWYRATLGVWMYRDGEEL